MIEDQAPSRALRRNEARAGLTPRFLLTKIILTAIIGAGLGFASAAAILGQDYPFEGVRVGPWTAWPQTGSMTIDPYARAILTRTGRTPLGLGEGLMFEARGDSAGEPFAAHCDYRIAGPISSARYWSLATLTRDGRAMRAGGGRGALTSSEVLRDADGSAEIIVASSARAGNWLPTDPHRPFMLLLTLYDSSLGATTAAIKGASLPNIYKSGCR